MTLTATPDAPATADPDGVLLRVRGVAVRYGAVRAIDDVDLDVRAGEVVALAGENGAGKSTLVRCIAGDLSPTDGTIHLDGRRLASGPGAVARMGVAVVWQDLALCDNLDVASNLLLGREGRLLRSPARLHATAAGLLASLGIPPLDTTRNVRDLSGGQRQILAVARAMRDRPRLLVLDEPTAALGVRESAQVEALTRSLRAQGTTILLISHDIDQMFRLADRVAVLRRGRVVGSLATATAHPDDVIALMSGQEVDTTARRQLDRLHGLVDQLASADPSSSLLLILSALGAALGTGSLCIHLVDAGGLRCAGAVGLPERLLRSWATLPLGAHGGPVGWAAATGTPVLDSDADPAWAEHRAVARSAGLGGSWSVPVTGAAGVLGVITAFGRHPGRPGRGELDLVTLYAGYAASAVERDRLLGEVTARNRVLETIREVLERLAGPVPLADGLDGALTVLRAGLGAAHVGLLGWGPDGSWRWRAWNDRDARPAPADPLVPGAPALLDRRPEGVAVALAAEGGRPVLAVRFPAPDGPVALLARWPETPAGSEGSGLGDGSALLEDAARSLQLAFEREESERAQREAAGLRRSQELQREFLSRLSHELRTPLTAIRGYASSLLQTDVTWDDDSEERFLSRIASESARLGRLVDDLLDLSAIESRILRLHRDWCDLGLVLDAARACLPLGATASVTITTDPGLPVVWADHDRLEQVFVNLMDNAVRHNPPGTSVSVTAGRLPGPAGGGDGGDAVVVVVEDDGRGVPSDLASAPFDGASGRRSPTAGAGLGLSIARAIVAAHGGSIRLGSAGRGARWRIEIPVGVGEHDEATGDRPRG